MQVRACAEAGGSYVAYAFACCHIGSGPGSDMAQVGVESPVTGMVVDYNKMSPGRIIHANLYYPPGHGSPDRRTHGRAYVYPGMKLPCTAKGSYTVTVTGADVPRTGPDKEIPVDLLAVYPVHPGARNEEAGVNRKVFREELVRSAYIGNCGFIFFRDL